MTHLGRSLALLVALSAVAARAEDKVGVTAEVVLASTSGNVIDPPSLASMKAKFAEKFKYTSFKRLSVQKVVITKGVTELQLPNKKVTFKLEELKDGIAKVKVNNPPMETVYTLGREGSLYIASGQHGGGDLWLVLSPAEGVRPRRLPPPHRATSVEG
ncbi:MAG: hypothetical protein HYZ28_19535 [Myxococcales bacterium]|nr:hypothetical protein [Myxococcales bacterium]